MSGWRAIIPGTALNTLGCPEAGSPARRTGANGFPVGGNATARGGSGSKATGAKGLLLFAGLKQMTLTLTGRIGPAFENHQSLRPYEYAFGSRGLCLKCQRPARSA